MADMIGPILVIVMVFVIYHFAGNLDIAPKVKLAKLDLDKISAETKMEEAKAHTQELQIQMGKLAIEAQKLQLDFDGPIQAKDAKYEILEDKKI